MNKEFDSEPVYGYNKYIKTKIKSYEDKANTNFCGKKYPKKYIIQVFSSIMLDSVMRENKKYYTQTLLEECKYKIKKIIKWKLLLMMILT